MKAPILAIDYGTSNSLVAGALDGKSLEAFKIDAAAADPTVLRSVMFCPDRKQWYFGEMAIQQYSDHAADGRLFRSVKKYLPEPSFTGTQLHGEFKSIVELISVFLKELRRRAAECVGVESDSVVLGRPAVFSSQKEHDALAESRLSSAAKLAGFKHIEFVPEPLAAAYEFRLQMTSEKIVLVADFGGGTSDFTVMKMGPRDLKSDDVLAIGGVAMAGDAFDGALMRYQIAPHFGSEIVYRLPLGSNDLHLPNSLIAKMCSPADMSLLANHDLLGVLKDAQRWSLNPRDAERMNRLFVVVEEHLGYQIFRSVERAKIALSTLDSAEFEFIHPGLSLKETVFAKDFKKHSKPNVDRIMQAMDQTVQASGVQYSQIDIVCFTGGTAKIPELRREIELRLGAEKVQEHRHFHSVVGGLAERARHLT